MMPRLNGLDATRRIRALPGPAARVPILAVTASAYPEDVAACHEAGMDDHVVKPIDRDTLLRKLGELAAAPRPALTRAAAMTDATDDAFAALPLLRDAGGGPPRLRIPGLDEEMALRLVPEFLREIRTARDDLRQVDLRAPSSVVAIAHRLAGSAATLGAERLTAAARALEVAAKQSLTGDVPQVPPLREIVLTIATETLVALETAVPVGAAAGIEA